MLVSAAGQAWWRGSRNASVGDFSPFLGTSPVRVTVSPAAPWILHDPLASASKEIKCGFLCRM